MENKLMINNNPVEDYKMENVKICTLDLEGNEENQTKLYNVLTGDADILLNDIIGETIEMVGAYLDKHPSTVIDDTTGEVTGITSKYRILLFDKEGKTYASGSYGIYNSLKMIFDIFGYPTEERPINVKVAKRETKTKGRDTLTLIKL